jgi:hypothetical protein
MKNKGINLKIKTLEKRKTLFSDGFRIHMWFM